MDATTERYLTDAGIEISSIEVADDAETATRIDILFEGALDESFYIDADANAARVVDVIADRMAQHRRSTPSARRVPSCRASRQRSASASDRLS